jgi:hypothetical protein
MGMGHSIKTCISAQTPGCGANVAQYLAERAVLQVVVGVAEVHAVKLG